MSYVIKQETLDGIADAIRLKTGTDADIQAEDFESAILSIRTCEDTHTTKEYAKAAAESAKASEASAESADSSALAASEAAGRAASSEGVATVKAQEAKATQDITKWFYHFVFILSRSDTQSVSNILRKNHTALSYANTLK